MSEHSLTTENKSTKNKLTAGLVLLAVGLNMLLFQVFGRPLLFPLVLGSVFLATGIATRKAGWLIPGGIIGGIGLGALVTEAGWLYPLGSIESGGIFLLGLALGCFLIALLSKLFTSEPQTWALVPGTAIAVIGGLVLAGERGLQVLETAGRFWPLILVVIGLQILYRWWKERA